MISMEHRVANMQLKISISESVQNRIQIISEKVTLKAKILTEILWWSYKGSAKIPITGTELLSSLF